MALCLVDSLHHETFTVRVPPLPRLFCRWAPVFTALTGIAYHCDISAHSFLVRGAAVAEEFSLLDFGLAVRAPSWTSDYKTGNTCGDPRNCSPAAWMLMVYGLRHLEALPDASLLRQYEQRIDHFSFGVMELEVLFALWNGPEEEDVGGPQDTRVQALTRAWLGRMGDVPWVQMSPTARVPAGFWFLTFVCLLNLVLLNMLLAIGLDVYNETRASLGPQAETLWSQSYEIYRRGGRGCSAVTRD